MLLLKKPALNTTQIENYWLVSLLPFLSKAIERAVFKQVTEFLSCYNLLDTNQSGFNSGHSMETSLLSVTEPLRIAKAAGQSSVLILKTYLVHLTQQTTAFCYAYSQTWGSQALHFPGSAHTSPGIPSEYLGRDNCLHDTASP